MNYSPWKSKLTVAGINTKTGITRLDGTYLCKMTGGFNEKFCYITVGRKTALKPLRTEKLPSEKRRRRRHIQTGDLSIPSLPAHFLDPDPWNPNPCFNVSLKGKVS